MKKTHILTICLISVTALFTTSAIGANSTVCSNSPMGEFQHYQRLGTETQKGSRSCTRQKTMPKTL